MIELRWRRANNEDKHPTSDTPVFYDRAVHGKTRFLVLQYREDGKWRCANCGNDTLKSRPGAMGSDYAVCGRCGTPPPGLISQQTGEWIDVPVEGD